MSSESPPAKLIRLVCCAGGGALGWLGGLLALVLGSGRTIDILLTPILLRMLPFGVLSVLICGAFMTRREGTVGRTYARDFLAGGGMGLFMACFTAVIFCIFWGLSRR